MAPEDPVDLPDPLGSDFDDLPDPLGSDFDGATMPYGLSDAAALPHRPARRSRPGRTRYRARPASRSSTAIPM